jgi:hypothetical protein
MFTNKVNQCIVWGGLKKGWALNWKLKEAFEKHVTEGLQKIGISDKNVLADKKAYLLSLRFLK